MPSRVERVEAQLYLVTWVHPLTFEDMVQAANLVEQQAAEYQEMHYGVITDFSQSKTLPFDIHRLRRLGSERLIAMVLLNPPMIAQVAANIIQKVTPSTIIRTAPHLDEAIKKCRELINRNEASVNR